MAAGSTSNSTVPLRNVTMFVPEPSSGDLSESGRQMIKAATDLNAGARSDPTGPEAVQFGIIAAERFQSCHRRHDIVPVGPGHAVTLPHVMQLLFERQFAGILGMPTANPAAPRWLIALSKRSGPNASRR